MCSGRVGSSCFTSGARRFNIVTNPVTSHEWGKDREVSTTSETYQNYINCIITHVRKTLIQNTILKQSSWIWSHDRLFRHVGIKKEGIDNVPFLTCRMPTKVLMSLTWVISCITNEICQIKNPPYFKDHAVPIMSCAYTIHIAIKIVNYKNGLQDGNIDDF